MVYIYWLAEFYKQLIYNSKVTLNIPASNYMFKVNNRTTRTRCEICSDVTIKTTEQRQWRRSGVFIVNFEQISHLVLVFLLLTLSRQMPAENVLYIVYWYSSWRHNLLEFFNILKKTALHLHKIRKIVSCPSNTIFSEVIFLMDINFNNYLQALWPDTNFMLWS